MSFNNRKGYKIMRIQFDAIGLTEQAGWSEDKIFEFVNTPNWFSQYSWNKKTKDACYQQMVKRRLVKKHDVNWHDINYGWKDKED
jgi:hypothetical protein